jgi:hypothetical protein
VASGDRPARAAAKEVEIVIIAGRGPNPCGRRSRRILIALLAGFVPLSVTAENEASSVPPASRAALGTEVAALPPSNAPGRELMGRFALPDESVRGSFQLFRVPVSAAAKIPVWSVGRIEALGVSTAIAAWVDSGELRIFRTADGRSNDFTCSCAVPLATPPSASRMVAEALACLELPVGAQGLQLNITRDRELSSAGPIHRATRGMDGAEAWSCPGL